MSLYKGTHKTPSAIHCSFTEKKKISFTKLYTEEEKMRLDERADLKAEKNENENGREASFTKLFKNKQEQIMKKKN